MFYWPAFVVFKLFFETYLSLKVYHRDKLPKRGRGYIIASNHLSNLDPMIIGVASDRRQSFLAKSSLFKNAFFGFVLSQVGAFPVRRGAIDSKALKEALRRLDAGGGLVMFPQGGRRGSDIEGSDIKAGVGFLAVKANVPIVPACIFGSDRAMPPGAKSVCRAKVTVAFGDPILVHDRSSYQEIADQVHTAMKDLAEQYKGQM